MHGNRQTLWCLSLLIILASLCFLRIDELVKLLREADFEIDVSQFTPFARNIITGKTGYLTPSDLEEFDQAVDAFCNGKFYTCGFSGEEIVNKLNVSGEHVLRY